MHGSPALGLKHSATSSTGTREWAIWESFHPPLPQVRLQEDLATASIAAGRPSRAAVQADPGSRPRIPGRKSAVHLQVVVLTSANHSCARTPFDRRRQGSEALAGHGLL